MSVVDVARRYLADHPAPVRARAYQFAEDAGISVATLRRRMRASQSSWSSLKAEELRRRIESGRRGGASLSIVSQQVGYQWPGSGSRLRRRHAG